MKRISLILICLGMVYNVNAQDFAANLQTARQSYNSGNLEGSRFAMEQMLQELEIISGKETLKILPSALGGLAAKTAEDEVTGGAGFAGAIIQRKYETDGKTATLEIISNSPLISSINAVLALPFIGSGTNGERRIIKIDGYKALIQRGSETDKPTYEIQIPLGSALVTVRTDNYTDDIMKIANGIPVATISGKLN